MTEVVKHAEKRAVYVMVFVMDSKIFVNLKFVAKAHCLHQPTSEVFCKKYHLRADK